MRITDFWVGWLHWNIGGKQSFCLIWSNSFFFFFGFPRQMGKNLKTLMWGQAKHFMWLKINIFFTIKWEIPVFSFCERNKNFSFFGWSQNFSVKKTSMINFIYGICFHPYPLLCAGILGLWLERSSVRTLTGGMYLPLEAGTKQEKSTSTSPTPWISCYVPFHNLALWIKSPWKV